MYEARVGGLIVMALPYYMTMNGFPTVVWDGHEAPFNGYEKLGTPVKTYRYFNVSRGKWRFFSGSSTADMIPGSRNAANNLIKPEILFSVPDTLNADNSFWYYNTNTDSSSTVDSRVKLANHVVYEVNNTSKTKRLEYDDYSGDNDSYRNWLNNIYGPKSVSWMMRVGTNLDNLYVTAKTCLNTLKAYDFATKDDNNISSFHAIDDELPLFEFIDIYENILKISNTTFANNYNNGVYNGIPGYIGMYLEEEPSNYYSYIRNMLKVVFSWQYASEFDDCVIMSFNGNSLCISTSNNDIGPFVYSRLNLEKMLVHTRTDTVVGNYFNLLKKSSETNDGKYALFNPFTLTSNKRQTGFNQQI